MRWTRFPLYLLLFMLVVVGGVALFFLTLDLNNYKAEIAALTQRFTGRTLALDGRIDLDLGALTTLELTDATFGNADWASAPYMARLKRVKVVIDLRSLFDGPVIVERFELEDAELNLESHEDGRDNWTFGATDEPIETDDDDDDDDDDAIPLIVRHAEAREFVYTQIVPAFARPIVFRARTLTQIQREDGLLDIDLQGERNEREVSLSGTYGPVLNLLEARDLQLDFEATVDTVAIRARGVVDDLLLPRRPSFELVIVGAATGEISDLLGLPTVSGRELDLEISVKPAEDGITAKIAGGVGDFKTDINARATELLTFDAFSIDAFVAGPNIANLLDLFGIKDVPAGPYELSGSVARDGDRLDFDDVRLSLGSATFDLTGSVNDFRNLDETNLKLQVYGNDVERFRALLGIPGAATGPFQISADLNVRPDGAELLELLVQTNIARLKIDGAIRGKSPAFVGTELRFDGTGKNLADVAEVYEIPNVIPESYSFNGAIELGDQKLATTDTVTVEVGENIISVEGTIGYAPLERDTDIRARSTGQDLAKIVAMAGVTELVPGVVYDISTGLKVTPEGYQVSNLIATLGPNKLALNGLISKAADFRGTRATFSAAGPELGNLLIDTESLDFAEGPFDASGSVELLADTIHLQNIKVEAAGAAASLDAEIGLPLESASGYFDVAANGPNLRAVVPPRLRWNPPESSFEIRATGKLADGLWSFDALSAQLADARLNGSGVFDQPPDLSRTQLTIGVRVPDTAALGTINDQPIPSTQVKIDMGFAGSPESFLIEPFTAEIGEGDIAGSLRADLDGEVPDIDLQLRSKSLNLDAVIADEQELAEELAETGDAEIDESADEQPADERVIADEPLNLEPLEKVNARVDIDVANLVFRGVKWRDIMIDGEVRDGGLVMERMNAVSPTGDLKSSFSLIQRDGSAEVSAKLDGKGIYLGLETRVSAEELAAAPAFDAQIELAGVGATPREIAGSLNGNAYVSSYGGRIPSARIGFIFGNFFSEVANSLNPFRKEEQFTELDCMVLLLDVDDGLVKVEPGLVLQSDKVLIAASGIWDLRTEELDIGFKTQPRSKVSISAGEFINPYLKVGGTMRDPQLTLDPSGTLVTGGAAVATVGLSLLATAVWDRMSRADDPCAAAVQAASEEIPERKKFLGIF